MKWGRAETFAFLVHGNVLRPSLPRGGKIRSMEKRFVATFRRLTTRRVGSVEATQPSGSQQSLTFQLSEITFSPLSGQIFKPEFCFSNAEKSSRLEIIPQHQRRSRFYCGKVNKKSKVYLKQESMFNYDSRLRACVSRVNTFLIALVVSRRVFRFWQLSTRDAFHDIEFL